MTIVKALFLYQLLIIISNASAPPPSADDYIDAFKGVQNTLEAYSELSVFDKVSEVKNKLKKFSNSLSAISGTAGAINALVNLAIGSVESRR